MAKLAKIKTTPTSSSVDAFIAGVANEQQRKDSVVILNLMERVAGEKPRMWGKSLIGFGEKRYKSEATGREVDWFKIGFAPRKANLSIHLAIDIHAQDDLLKKLGKHKTGAGCLYINKVSDIDLKVLEKLITTAVKQK